MVFAIACYTIFNWSMTSMSTCGVEEDAESVAVSPVPVTVAIVASEGALCVSGSIGGVG